LLAPPPGARMAFATGFPPHLIVPAGTLTRKRYGSLYIPLIFFGWISEEGVLTALKKEESRVYEFGPFRLDRIERLLLRDGRAVQLAPKVFDTLVALVENGGHLVTKDDLMSTVWPDAFVEDGTLTRNISDLRKALGEVQGGERYIETVPRHGYRFSAPVSVVAQDPAPLIIEKHTRSRVITREDVEPEILPPGVEIIRQRNRPLRRMLAVPLLLLVAVAAAFVAYRYVATKSRVAPVRSIAVLPFTSFGEERGDEYLELGMADALITRLTNVKNIVVRPSSSVLKYNQPGRDAMVVGRELGVDAVLEGQIQRSGEQVRVTAQLVSMKEGVPLWAETFDVRFTDIFAMQDSISQQLVETLALNLSGEERKQLTRRYTENTDAYEAYIRGRFWWNKRYDEGFRKAIDYFNQAIAIDPNYALAYAGLADCYAILSPYNVSKPEESFPKAKAAVTRALEIDERLVEARTSLAHITWMYDWDWAGAEREFRRAIDINPNYATAHEWYSVFLSAMGRHDEAIRTAKQAYQLEPLSLAIIRDLARAYYHARQYDEAIATYLKAIELDPRHYRYNSWLELAYVQKGSYDQAVEVYLKAMNIIGADAKEKASLEKAYRANGWQGYCRRRLELMQEHSDRFFVIPYNMARASALVGEKTEALAWLEKAYADHSDHLVLLKVDPIFDPLRPDPRFADLIRRVGLPQ
jgi:DNA-binding winged helix-turn-helix (wHTH) protein/TolB-like protein